MLETKMEIALNQQVNAELWSSYLYLSMSYDMDNKGYEGMASWFAKQAKEEFEHATRFMKFIGERDGKVKLMPIEEVRQTWNSPKDAFEEASAILVNQYTALAGSTVIEADVLPNAKSEDDNSMLGMSLEDLNLSVRTYNALINGDINTIGEMINAYNSGELDNLKGFGETARKEVEQRIGELEF